MGVSCLSKEPYRNRFAAKGMCASTPTLQRAQTADTRSNTAFGVRYAATTRDRVLVRATSGETVTVRHAGATGVRHGRASSHSPAAAPCATGRPLPETHPVHLQ
jgi:hypothetical protein